MAKEEKLEEAKRLYKDANADQRYVLESLFPELAEIEEVRIRKRIIQALHGDVLDMEETTKAIDWLEKQCEQKYTPKYKVGDTIYYNSFGEVKSMIVANVVVIDDDDSMYEDENGGAVFEKDLIEQKSTDKVEPKFDVGDKIQYSKGCGTIMTIEKIENGE